MESRDARQEMEHRDFYVWAAPRPPGPGNALILAILRDGSCWLGDVNEFNWTHSDRSDAVESISPIDALPAITGTRRRY